MGNIITYRCCCCKDFIKPSRWVQIDDDSWSIVYDTDFAFYHVEPLETYSKILTPADINVCGLRGNYNGHLAYIVSNDGAPNSEEFDIIAVYEDDDNYLYISLGIWYSSFYFTRYINKIVEVVGGTPTEIYNTSYIPSPGMRYPTTVCYAKSATGGVVSLEFSDPMDVGGWGSNSYSRVTFETSLSVTNNRMGFRCYDSLGWVANFRIIHPTKPCMNKCRYCDYYSHCSSFPTSIEIDVGSMFAGCTSITPAPWTIDFSSTTFGNNTTVDPAYKMVGSRLYPSTPLTLLGKELYHRSACFSTGELGDIYSPLNCYVSLTADKRYQVVFTSTAGAFQLYLVYQSDIIDNPCELTLYTLDLELDAMSDLKPCIVVVPTISITLS